jgi:hypothetical protein
MLAIVESNVKRAADSYYDFFASAVGMSSTAFTAGYIISPVNTCNFKRNVDQLFRYCKVPAWIYMLW